MNNRECVYCRRYTKLKLFVHCKGYQVSYYLCGKCNRRIRNTLYKLNIEESNRYIIPAIPIPNAEAILTAHRQDKMSNMVLSNEGLIMLTCILGTGKIKLIQKQCTCRRR